MRTLLLLSVLLLSACTLGRQASGVDTAVYDLGPGPGKTAVAPLPGIVLEVRMPQWLDALNVQYRLLYGDRTRVHEYAYARWAGNPASLVQQRLRQHLGLPTVQGGVAATCMVSLDVEEFGQVFSAPGQSGSVIRGEARLLGKGRQWIASRPILVEVPAVSADAAGGIAALAAGTDRLAAELGGWLAEQATNGKTGGCAR